MSFVCGVDLSSRAIDCVLLDETTNAARWHRFELQGETAWARALNVREAMTEALVEATPYGLTGNSPSLWDDVYLVAVETPIPDQRKVLRLIQGAFIASLPAQLRQPHRCWQVTPTEWKKTCGIKGNAKPTDADLSRIAPGALLHRADIDRAYLQNAYDAYCIAWHARETNRKAVEAAA